MVNGRYTSSWGLSWSTSWFSYTSLQEHSYRDKRLMIFHRRGPWNFRQLIPSRDILPERGVPRFDCLQLFSSRSPQNDTSPNVFYVHLVTHKYLWKLCKVC